MVDMATPTTVGRHTQNHTHAPLPDDDTFRVAEELMLLSASRTNGSVVTSGGSSFTGEDRRKRYEYEVRMGCLGCDCFRKDAGMLRKLFNT